MTAAGHAAPGFEAVRAVFEENFAERGELGAAFAAYVDGVAVVDLWGGVADAGTRRAWRQDSLTVVFSGTKAMAAVCVLALVERGLLALDRPVADVWPEFAAAGKEAITVAEVLSHRARLPVIHAAVRHRDLADDRAMAARLAAQPAETDPRAASMYHPLTYGWLCGELVRRASGVDIGRFFAEHVAAPLGLELWIGLPPSLESRMTRLTYGAGWASPHEAWVPGGEDQLMTWLLTNPVLFPRDAPYWNEPWFHQAQLAGSNGIGTARSMARFYACLVAGGELDGVRVLRPETLARAQAELSRFDDPVTGEPHRYGVGFQLATRWPQLGPAAVAFGHRGAGGSVHGAWPELRVGFSYVMNELRGEDIEPRAGALLDALYSASQELVDRSTYTG